MVTRRRVQKKKTCRCSTFANLRYWPAEFGLDSVPSRDLFAITFEQRSGLHEFRHICKQTHVNEIHVSLRNDFFIRAYNLVGKNNEETIVFDPHHQKMQDKSEIISNDIQSKSSKLSNAHAYNLLFMCSC